MCVCGICDCETWTIEGFFFFFFFYFEREEGGVGFHSPCGQSFICMVFFIAPTDIYKTCLWAFFSGIGTI